MSGVPASETKATASLAHPLDQAGADPVGIVIVIGEHRPLRADMGEQPGGDPAVLDRDQVGARQYVGGARAQIGEIADRGGDDIEAGFERIVHREHRHGISSPSPASRALAGEALASWLLAMLTVAMAACVPRARRPAPLPTEPVPWRSSRERPSRLPADETRNRVAVLVPLSGGNAALGQSILNAANLALLDTGGQRIRITAYDTAERRGAGGERGAGGGQRADPRPAARRRRARRRAAGAPRERARHRLLERHQRRRRRRLSDGHHARPVDPAGRCLCARRRA